MHYVQGLGNGVGPYKRGPHDNDLNHRPTPLSGLQARHPDSAYDVHTLFLLLYSDSCAAGAQVLPACSALMHCGISGWLTTTGGPEIGCTADAVSAGTHTDIEPSSTTSPFDRLTHDPPQDSFNRHDSPRILSTGIPPQDSFNSKAKTDLSYPAHCGLFALSAVTYSYPTADLPCPAKCRFCTPQDPPPLPSSTEPPFIPPNPCLFDMKSNPEGPPSPFESPAYVAYSSLCEKREWGHTNTGSPGGATAEVCRMLPCFDLR